MHEWSLVADALADLKSETAGSPLSTVTLRLGPRTDPATVRAAWEQLTTDSPLHESELVLEHRDDLLRCFDCELEFRGQLPDQCPDCRGHGLVIERTADLTVGAQEPGVPRERWPWARGPAEATPAEGTS